MNQLGFFDTVKKEDYEITQNAKDSTVDITLKVKEKGKNSDRVLGWGQRLGGKLHRGQLRHQQLPGAGRNLSVQTEWGTYQKLYSFGFTEPYIFDRPMTLGLRSFAAITAMTSSANWLMLTASIPRQLENSSAYGQYYAQNFQQNSSGFHGLYQLSFAAPFRPRRRDLQLLLQQHASLQCGFRVVLRGDQLPRPGRSIGAERHRLQFDHADLRL